MSDINRKAIDGFISRCTLGARLVCLDNTYRPAPVGVHRVTRPGKTSIRLDDESGRGFWMEAPRRVSDVVALDADTITYRIGRDDHTATWHILADRGDGA